MNKTKAAKQPSIRKKSLIIGCTLRSGSNLLCEILDRLGYGKPTEFFQENRYSNPVTERDGIASSLPNLDAFRQSFLDRHKGSSWFGAKLNWQQYSTFTEALAASSSPEAGDMEDWFPQLHWVFLSRRDLIAQAVSMFIAKRTNAWIAGDPVNLQEVVEYKFDAILEEFIEFSVEEALWERFFKTNGIPFVHVYFEDLIRNYGREVRRILALIDPEKVDTISELDELPTNLKNQVTANLTTQDMVKRFTDDLIAGNYRQNSEIARMYLLLNAALMRPSHDPLIKLLGQHQGQYPVIAKVPLKANCLITGPHAFVHREHFIDGMAIRLDPQANFKTEFTAQRVLIEFMGHEWSGYCEISINGEPVERFDLYSAQTITRPWMREFATPLLITLEVRNTGERSLLSNGAEIWLQRIWTLDTP